ncbi:hypothetical protein LJR231_002244 [Phyllobacterium sp. LjRoot231]|uniref:hypothetical protein n=1 Tax=Phyllobacterium sp. LjRoot231 TaxID=3342289 RepID=UPI003ECD2B6E
MTPLSLSENPFVVDPRQSLTARQRQIIWHVDMFTVKKRSGDYFGAGECIGASTVRSLKKHGLVKEVLVNGRWILRLTELGKMALDQINQKAKAL